MCSPAARQRGDSVQLGREPGLDDPAHTAVLVVANAGISVMAQVAEERGAVESQELVSVGDAPLVPPPDAAVSRRFGLHGLSVLLEPGEDL